MRQHGRDWQAPDAIRSGAWCFADGLRRQDKAATVDVQGDEGDTVMRVIESHVAEVEEVSAQDRRDLIGFDGLCKENDQIALEDVRFRVIKCQNSMFSIICSRSAYSRYHSGLAGTQPVIWDSDNQVYIGMQNSPVRT